MSFRGGIGIGRFSSDDGNSVDDQHRGFVGAVWGFVGVVELVHLSDEVSVLGEDTLDLFGHSSPRGLCVGGENALEEGNKSRVLDREAMGEESASGR